MSHTADGGPGSLSPWRISRNAPSSTHWKEARPLIVSVDFGRNAELESSISHSPTSTARSWRAGLGWGQVWPAFSFFVARFVGMFAPAANQPSPGSSLQNLLLQTGTLGAFQLLLLHH